MRRLFLLSMAFTGVVGIFIVSITGLFEVLNDPAPALFAIFMLLISSSGFITLGVMLVKHVRDIFRK